MIGWLRENGYNVALRVGGGVSIKPPPPLELVPELKQNKIKIIAELKAEAEAFSFLNKTPFTEKMIKEGLRKWKQPFDEHDFKQIETGELSPGDAVQYLYWWTNNNRDRYNELKQDLRPCGK